MFPRVYGCLIACYAFCFVCLVLLFCCLCSCCSLWFGLEGVCWLVGYAVLGILLVVFGFG